MRRHSASVVAAAAIVVATLGGAGGARQAAGSAGTDWRPSDARVNDATATFGGPALGHREPAIAVDPRNPDVMIAVTIDQNPTNQVPAVAGYGGWNHIFRSTDGGVTWRDVRLLDWPLARDNRYSGDPGVVFGSDGTAYVVSLSDSTTLAHRRQLEVFKSTDEGRTWTGPSLAFHYVYDPDHSHCVSSDKELLGIDRRTNELLITYTGTSWRCGDADADLITENVGSVPPDASMDIFLTRSRDGGHTWSAPTSVYHGYALGSVPVVGPDGTIYVSFAGAAPVGAAPSCPSAVGTIASYRPREMEMIVAMSHDHGATWAYERRGLCEAEVFGTLRASARKEADATGGWLVGSIAVDPSDGRVYAVWPTFSPLQAPLRYGVETMSTADGGRTWSPTKLLSDPAGDGALPAVAASGGVARGVWIGTSDGWNTYDAYWSQSSDGGATWSSPARLSSQTGSGQGEIGDYISATAEGDRVAAMWTQRRGAATDVFVRATRPGAVVSPAAPARAPGRPPDLAPTGGHAPIAAGLALVAATLAIRRVLARRRQLL